MKEIIVRQTEGRALKFKGELVAHVQTSQDRAHSNWSGSTGRWEEYKLWRTSGGNYVGLIVHRTCWQGERDQAKAKLCNGPEGVFSFFGEGSLAQELYTQANLDFIQEVD